MVGGTVSNVFVDEPVNTFTQTVFVSSTSLFIITLPPFQVSDRFSKCSDFALSSSLFFRSVFARHDTRLVLRTRYRETRRSRSTGKYNDSRDSSRVPPGRGVLKYFRRPRKRFVSRVRREVVRLFFDFVTNRGPKFRSNPANALVFVRFYVAYHFRRE